MKTRVCFWRVPAPKATVALLAPVLFLALALAASPAAAQTLTVVDGDGRPDVDRQLSVGCGEGSHLPRAL